MYQKNSNLPTNKNFGITIGIVLVVIFFLSQIKLFLFLGLVIFILGLLNSKYLTQLNIYWMKFGFLLSKLLNPIILGFLFILLFIPIGFFLKLFKKDILNVKLNDNVDTNWINKEKEVEHNMKDQF
jgi:hypothetical protein